MKRIPPSPFRWFKSLPSWLGKGEGEPCKQGETAASTGCIPSSGESGGKTPSGKKPVQPLPFPEENPNWKVTQKGVQQLVKKVIGEVHTKLTTGRPLSEDNIDKLKKWLHHTPKAVMKSLYEQIIGEALPTAKAMQASFIAYAKEQVKGKTPPAEFKEETILPVEAKTEEIPFALPTPISPDLLKSTNLHTEGSPWGIVPPGKKPAYGGVMFNEKGEVLLREPAGHFDNYHWTFAKGKMDSGDVPYDTAVRENEEETGYTPNVVGYVPGGYAGGTSSNYYYLMTVKDHVPEKMDKETSQVKWVSIEEAKKLIGETTNPLGKKRDLAVLEAAAAEWNKLTSGVAPPPEETAGEKTPQPPEPGFTGIDANGHHWVNGKQVAKGKYDTIMGVKLPTQSGYLKDYLVKASLESHGMAADVATAKAQELQTLFNQAFQEAKDSGLDDSAARKKARATVDPLFRDLLKGLLQKEIPLTSAGGLSASKVMSALLDAGLTDDQVLEIVPEIKKVFNEEGPEAAAMLFNEKLEEAIASKEAAEKEKVNQLTAPPPKGIDTAKELATIPDSLNDLKEIKPLGGASGANATLMEDAKGNKYVRKSGAANLPQIESEVTADTAYNLLGIPSTFDKLVTGPDGTTYKLSKWVEGTDLKDVWNTADEATKEKLKQEVQKGFVTDCLFANWDVVGFSKDNIKITPDGKAVRIDNGGAFLFTAMGKQKGAFGKGEFGDTVPEIERMRDPHINPQAAEIFSGITLEEIQKQVRGIYQKRKELLQALPKGKVRDTVAKRIEWLKKHYGPKSTKKSVAANSIYAGEGQDWPAKSPDSNNTYVPPPVERNNIIFQELTDNVPRLGFYQSDYAPSFKQHQTAVISKMSGPQKNRIVSYTGSGSAELNRLMRQCPENLDCLGSHYEKMNSAIEKTIAAAGRFAEPVNVWRNATMDVDSTAGKDFMEVLQYALETGEDVRIPGVKSTSMDPNHSIGGGNIKLEIKAKSGIWVENISQYEHEQELLQGHNTRYRVIAIKDPTDFPAGSQWGIHAKKIIQLEEI